jgi:sulfate permease, SulP family
MRFTTLDTLPTPMPPSQGWGFMGELRGGVTTAVLTLVTAISYAAVAGAPLGGSMSAAAVLSGLIGAVLGGMIASLLGPVPTQIFSPRASVAVVIASAAIVFSKNASFIGGSQIQVLALLTACLLLAAALQCAFGLLKFGAFIRLVPHSVTAGFTIGLAIEMILSQLPHLAPKLNALGYAHVAPLVVGLTTVAAISLMRWRGWSGWAMPVGLLGGVLSHQLLGTFFNSTLLPSLQVINVAAAPLFSVIELQTLVGTELLQNQLPNLVAFAFVIAFVNSIETLTSAVVLEELTRCRFDANRALIAGAVGSLVAVCAGGLPVAGSAATSVVNVKAGGRSRQSALIAGVVLLTLAYLCRNWLDWVPLAAVAGLVLTVAVELAYAPFIEITQPLRRMSRKVQRAFGDIAVAVLVCVLLVTTDIVTAVIGGLFAATIPLVMQMRQTLVRRQYDGNHPTATALIESAIEPKIGGRIQIVEVAQPLFFATAEVVIEVIERLDSHMRVVILDLTHMGAIDATASRTLARCTATLRSRNQQLLIVAAKHVSAFDQIGLPCSLFANLTDALNAAVTQCENSRTKRVKTKEKGAMLDTAPVVAPTTDAEVFVTLASHTSIDTNQWHQKVPSFVNQILDRMNSRIDYSDDAQRATYARANGPSTEMLYEFEPAQPSLPTIAPEVIEQATRALSAYLGPTAGLLVDRALVEALNAEHLFRLLSRHLSSAEARHAFISTTSTLPTFTQETSS